MLKHRFPLFIEAVDPGFGGVGATNVPSGLFVFGKSVGQSIVSPAFGQGSSIVPSKVLGAGVLVN